MSTMHILPGSTHTPLQTTPVQPIAYAVALKPWFSRKIIEEGFRLLQDDHVLYFSFLRRYGGLVLDDGLSATVHMAPGKGRLRYVIRDGQCSQCVSRQGGSRCKHVAALALLCLHKEADRLNPRPDIFPCSPWAIIGKYLHTRSEMTPITLTLTKKREFVLFSGRDDCGLKVHVALSQEAAGEILCLHSLTLSGETPPSRDAEPCSALRQLRDLLANLTASSNERILNRNGSKSKQQHVDESIWMHLARLLFLHVPADQLLINKDKDGIFRLQAPRGKNPLFQLIPDRLHTWEILSQFELRGDYSRRPSATQFSKVQFSEDGQMLSVEHCCRLDDGREFSLAELASRCYGTHYLMDNHFFSLKSIPAEERLKTREKKQLSLFAIAEKKPAATGTGFTVAAEDLKDFLRLNHDQLRCSRHRVADDVLSLHFVDIPAQLVLENCEEHDDWCYLAGWYDLGNRRIKLADLLNAAGQKKTLLPGASWMQLDDSPLAWFHHLGRDRIIEGKGGKDKWIKMRRSELMVLGAQIGRVHAINPGNKKRILSFLESADALEFPAITDKMSSHLRAYQRHGAAWLYHLRQNGLGGILADDMGLGKTHQALTLIGLMADRNARFLIVCPASVLYHWREKQRGFFPHISLSLYHGPQRDLESTLTNRVIVTTYGVLRSDADLLCKTPFNLVIFDEMQVLKNRSTGVHQAAVRLKAGSVIGLTGTPVENRIEELESLLSLCLPDLLAIAGIRRQFRSASTPEARQRLRKMITPFILRRTREQVLPELPERSEDVRLCELSPDQVAAYRQAVERVKGTVDNLLENEIRDNYTHILATIIRLKQICNHLCLLQNCTDWNRYKSGKWNEFTTLIKECLEADLKIVVFSQFTSMLDIIEAWLADEQVDYVALRGSVAAGIRSKLITRFNTVTTCRVCCASLLAGGTGIDLTGAQVVVHFDRWWNPAKEEQATARVHRMGQRHPVQVYKLITVGTLEEKIHRLIEQKRTLAADLITEDDGSILKQLNRRELAGLFQFSKS